MLAAGIQRDLTVFGLADLELQLFEDLAGNLADNPAVINDQEFFHRRSPTPYHASMPFGTGCNRQSLVAQAVALPETVMEAS